MAASLSRRVLFCSAQPACARIPLQRTDAPKALPVAVGVGLTPSGAGARAGDEGDWAGQPCSEPEVEGTLQSNSRTTLPNSTRGDTITSSILRGNHSGAVACDNAQLSVKGTLLADTAAATYVRTDDKGRVQSADLADGLLANGCANLVVDHTAAIGQTRAGFLLNNSSGAKLTHNFATGGVFGLATQGKSDLDDGGNLMQGSAQNRAGDQGLLVPPPPTL